MITRRTKILILSLALLTLVVLGARLVILWHGERAYDDAAASFVATVGPLDHWAHAHGEVERPANAAHWAQAGALTVVLDEDQRAALVELTHRSVESWTVAERELMTATVAENDLALEVLHRAAGLDRSNFDLDFYAGTAMPIPNLLSILKAARLLLAEARLAVLDARLDEAVKATRSLWSLARACQRESPLIFQMIGLALEHLSWNAARELVLSGGDDAALLAELHEPLLAEPIGRQLARSISFEASLLRAPDREGYLLQDHGDAEALSYYTGVVELYPERSLAELRQQDADTLRAPHSKRGFVVDLSGILGRFKAIEAVRELSAVALDVLREGRETGSYPADLAAYPAASTNAYTGLPLDYRLEPDGTAVLSIPGAVELWQSNRMPAQAKTGRHPDFSWRLPPLSSPI